MIRKINLSIGLLLLVFFLLTGQYMQRYYYPAHEADLLLRMEIRANHLYIFSMALTNILAFGIPKMKLDQRWSWLDKLWRSLLLIAGVSVAIGFVLEHQADLSERIFTGRGLQFAFGGGIVFLVASYLNKLD